MTGAQQPWNGPTTPHQRPDGRPRWKKKRYWIPAAGFAPFIGLGAIGAATAPAKDTTVRAVVDDQAVTAAPTTTPPGGPRLLPTKLPRVPTAAPTSAPPTGASPTSAPSEATVAPPPSAAPKTTPPRRTVAPAPPTRPKPVPTTVRPKPQPKPSPTRTAPAPPSTDPRFPTCKAAKAAGYGPYVRGRDAEYGWYRDADSDGIVCE